MTTRRWVDWVNVMLGVWLIASPWLLTVVASDRPAAWSSWSVGAAIVTVAFLAMYKPAIEKAEAKRRELMDLSSEVKDSAKVVSMLPKAAELYRKQISDGLEGDPEAAAKARTTSDNTSRHARRNSAATDKGWRPVG